MSAPAYVIVEMNILDMEQYRKYMAEAPATIKDYGGEYIVRGGRHEVLEGDWKPHRLALLRFPSYEKAKAWYEQSNYRQVRELRAGTTEYFNMVLVEGVAAPVQPAGQQEGRT